MLEILGKDIEIDQYGEVILTSTGDVSVVEGLPNMYQALRNRLSSERGDLVYDNSYGLVLEEFIGSKNIIENVNQFKLEIIKELKKDNRITVINNIFIEQLPNDPKSYEIVILLRVAEVEEEVAVSTVFPFFTPSVEAREITDELQYTLGKDKVTTEFVIHELKSIFLSTDTSKTGTNYALGGLPLADNRTIQLGNTVTSNRTPVLITYTTLETERLGNRTELVTELVTITESVTGEEIDLTTVRVNSAIYDVIGVWDVTDSNKDYTNYFIGGSYRNNIITLGRSLPYPMELTVTYYKLT